MTELGNIEPSDRSHCHQTPGCVWREAGKIVTAIQTGARRKAPLALWHGAERTVTGERLPAVSAATRKLLCWRRAMRTETIRFEECAVEV